MTSPLSKTKNQIQTPDDLVGIVTAFRQSQIILTGFSLGVFTALGGRSQSSTALAKRLKVNERGLDRLMNALCALGLLKKNRGLFSNTQFSTRHLVKGKPGYMGGLAHTANLWSSWSTLPRAVRHGGAVRRRPTGDGSAAENVRGFIAAMHRRASSQAAAVVRLLDLSSTRRTLDLGGGSGAFSIALVRAKKDIQATVFDRPAVIPLTRAYVREARLAARFKYVSGDFHNDAIGSGYDLILLSAVVHMNSVSANLKLFKKCAAALNPGGRLVVLDHIMNADRTKPAAGAIFAMNMLVNTPSGDTYTEAEIRSWMNKAGLSGIRRRVTPFETSFMTGQRA